MHEHHPTLQFGFSRPVPVILQTEASECALACAAMLVSYHGLDTDLWSLRQNHTASMRGTSLDQLGRNTYEPSGIDFSDSGITGRAARTSRTSRTAR